MPKQRRTRSRSRYSPYQKSMRMRNVTTVSIPRQMPSLMPDQFVTKLRYFTNFTLTPTGGTVASRAFSANGLWDPDVSGIGHQPRGFDQLMSIYRHYNVTKCEMKASYDHDSSSSFYIAGIHEDTVSGLFTDPEDVMEKSKMTYFASVRDTTKASTKYTCYPHRRLGLNNPGNVQSTQQGSNIANPIDQIYLKPFVFYPGSVGSAILVAVQIDYTAVFSEIGSPSKS